jgi:DNA-directed RNA polymerase specialized sigma24 family protein
MNNAAVKALEAADWKELGPRVLRATYYFIARERWRGIKVVLSVTNELTIEGMGAEDFINAAIEKLMSGQRTYRPDLSVEENLRRTIESDVFSFRKTVRRVPWARQTLEQAAEDPETPLTDETDEQLPGNTPETEELVRRQREMLAAFSATVADDEELTLVLFAFEEGKYKPAEIEAATGIPAIRASELKRKLSERADKFLKTQPQYADLKPLGKVT